MYGNVAIDGWNTYRFHQIGSAFYMPMEAALNAALTENPQIAFIDPFT